MTKHGFKLELGVLSELTISIDNHKESLKLDKGTTIELREI